MAAKKKPVKKSPAKKPAVKKPTAKRKLIKLPAPVPLVFIDAQRRVFLLTKPNGSSNEYVTRQDEEIRVVNLEVGPPKTYTKGGQEYKVQETHCTEDLKPYEQSSPEHCAKSLMNSNLPKTNQALRALCGFLGMPVPEVPEHVKRARKAAGERLKAARPERVGYTIQQLCESIGVKPSDARKALRKGNVERPEAGWVWPTQAEAEAVARNVGLIKSSAAKKKAVKK